MSRWPLRLSLTAAMTGDTAMADVPVLAVDIAPTHSLVALVFESAGPSNLIVQPGTSPQWTQLTSFPGSRASRSRSFVLDG